MLSHNRTLTSTKRTSATTWVGTGRAQHSVMSIFQDCRYALRLLRKSPGFSVVAVLALALGIGANTAIFSVVNSILLRSLPYRDASRLVVAWETNASRGWQRSDTAGSTFLDWKEQSASFEDMAVLERGSGTVNGFGEPEQIPGLRVSANYFDMLGVGAALGRTFLPAEGHGGRKNVIVISYRLWQKLMHGDRSAIGRTVILDGLPYTLIGVLPSDFWTPVPGDGFVPWPQEELRRYNRNARNLSVIGKLKPGVTPDQAKAELDTIERRLAGQFPALQGWSTTVTPLKEVVVANIRPALLILLAAVGFVLLIACANLANLLLARGATRMRETAIRGALGAGRVRLIRQYLSENLLLALIGGILGLLLALWGVDLLEAAVPHNISATGGELDRQRIAIDGVVLAFTFLLSAGTGIVFGIIPALAASRADVSSTLKEGGRTTAAAGRRMRSALAISEIALALVLLICAGLTIKSFWRIRHVDPGFRPGHALAMEMELPTDSRYRQPREQADFFRRVLDHVGEVPGVTAAGVGDILPLQQADDRTSFLIEGRPPLSNGQRLSANDRSVSEKFFAAMGIPLREGREFTAHDKPGRPLVVIVDDAFVKRFFLPEGIGNPIGQRLRFTQSVREIVGVVGSVRHAGLNQEPAPTIYLPFEQNPSARMSLVTRTAVDPSSLIRAVKNAIYAVDRDQPVYDIRTMEQAVQATTASERLTISLLGVFAAVAVFLASLGIYGVMSYTVAQRRHEVGIRMALGAGSRDVLRLVLRQGFTLAGIGIAAGLAAGGCGHARALCLAVRREPRRPAGVRRHRRAARCDRPDRRVSARGARCQSRPHSLLAL